jgi:hypothetical protein
VAGAAQVAGDQVGAGAQLLREARLGRQTALLGQVAHGDAQPVGGDEQTDAQADSNSTSDRPWAR